MLRRTLFGEAGLQHIEYREFERGLNLTCSNGFTLFSVRTYLNYINCCFEFYLYSLQLFDSFDGGNPNILTALDLGRFESWDSCQHFITFSVASDIADALAALPSFRSTSFKQLFEEFMNGTGIPHGQIVADVIAAGDFPENLSELAAQPGFRTQCLFFSATMRERHDGETSIKVWLPIYF
jgi:hypothetical protein